VLTVITALIPGTDVLSIMAIVVALMVTRFLVGMVQAPFFPVTIGGSIVSWFPVRQWGLANGLTSTGLTLGAAATAPLIVWLMSAYGWRSALLITAPAGLLVAVLFHWYVRDDPGAHPKITDEELSLIASDRPPGGDVPGRGAWKLALRNRNVLLITISYFCMNYVFYLFFSWFFFYLVDVKGVSTTDCDFLVRRVGLGRGPRWLVMTALIMSATFLYVGAMAEDPLVSVVLLCIAFGCTQLSEAPFWVATMAVSGRHAPIATGVLNTGGSIFAIVGAFLWLFIRADEPMSV